MDVVGWSAGSARDLFAAPYTIYYLVHGCLLLRPAVATMGRSVVTGSKLNCARRHLKFSTRACVTLASLVLPGWAAVHMRLAHNTPGA